MDFNWTSTSAVGVLKNHFISNELLVQSVAKMKIVPFTTPLPSFGKHKGEV